MRSATMRSAPSGSARLDRRGPASYRRRSQGRPFFVARLGIAPALTDGVFVEDDPPRRIRDPNWMARSKQVVSDA